MTFNLPSNITIDYTGKKDCRMKTTGAGKKRCTVVCTVTADGRKYPLSVIFRGKRKHGAGVLPPGCKFPVLVQPSAWNDEDGCMKWARDIFPVRQDDTPAARVGFSQVPLMWIKVFSAIKAKKCLQAAQHAPAKRRVHLEPCPKHQLRTDKIWDHHNSKQEKAQALENACIAAEVNGGTPVAGHEQHPPHPSGQDQWRDTSSIRPTPRARTSGGTRAAPAPPLGPGPVAGHEQHPPHPSGQDQWQDTSSTRPTPRARTSGGTRAAPDPEPGVMMAGAGQEIRPKRTPVGLSCFSTAKTRKKPNVLHVAGAGRTLS
uniref:DDE-1 domain-containing protein n=1 Tax=Branchiostoma floridae TaxID=7739 RepID=C4A056_BRAFL|eukprot:XP_002585813.1 hypothetical protein BRAFLDRAFT_111068 [Branchiostoma floridae]